VGSDGLFTQSTSPPSSTPPILPSSLPFPLQSNACVQLPPRVHPSSGTTTSYGWLLKLKRLQYQRTTLSSLPGSANLLFWRRRAMVGMRVGYDSAEILAFSFLFVVPFGGSSDVLSGLQRYVRFFGKSVEDIFFFFFFLFFCFSLLGFFETTVYPTVSLYIPRCLPYYFLPWYHRITDRPYRSTSPISSESPLPSSPHPSYQSFEIQIYPPHHFLIDL
jgi:hypothetical protein